VRRYKRFLADVTLPDGREVTSHCANTGSMRGLTEPGSRVWLTPHDDPKRKLQWSWQIASDGDVLVGVNTSLPNRLVATACQEGALPSLEGYGSLRREVPYGENSRIDVLLQEHPTDERPCYVEVKSVTLGEGRVARFPDAVTARGLKHVHELRRVVETGGRAVAFFLVQREDCPVFAPAWTIDPAYSAALVEAAEAGVEVMAFTASVQPEGVGLGSALEVQLEDGRPRG
jgi:sugar fermentation stimulation protein A